MSEFEVEVQGDYLERLARATAPNAIAELIWNSLDAEATVVEIETTPSLIAGDLGIDQIIITDNGHGFTHEDANEQFKRLGGSWKATAAKSKNGKTILHGRSGQGRFKALALGNSVEWASVAGADDGFAATTVRIHRSTPKRGTVSEASTPVDGPSRTTVTISDPTHAAAWFLKTDDVVAKLIGVFALRLMTTPGLAVTVDGERLDPNELHAWNQSYSLDLPGIDEHVELQVIEWSMKDVDRKLHLCNADGMSMAEMVPGIHAPMFNFTAYVKWDGFQRHGDLIDLAEGNDILAPVIEAARDQLRKHFARRLSERDGDVLKKWRSSKVYPYTGQPADEVERIERQVFDLTALTMNAATPAFAKSEVPNQRITLRLLREAVAQSPESVLKVLAEVAKLDRQRLNELAQILEHTSLPKLVAAGHTVTHRLTFLRALEVLVFDYEKVVNERDHLHKILNSELWVFGDEWTDAISERSLTSLLEQHLTLLGEDRIEVETPVTTLDGNPHRRVDLMLSGVVPGVGARRRHHLVIELKRPSLKLGLKELTQLKQYAGAVSRDQRFSANDVYWEFWLVGNEMDADLGHEVQEQSDRPRGVASRSANQTIYVFGWNQIIERCRRRLEFMKTVLEHESTDEQAMTLLQGLYRKYLPETMRGDVDEQFDRPEEAGPAT